MTQTQSESLFDRKLETEETAFVVTVGILVFTLGYQLGAVLHGGEFDALIVLSVCAATAATFLTIHADEDDEPE